MKDCIKDQLDIYFSHFKKGEKLPCNLYEIFKKEFDKNIIKYVLKKTGNNKAKATKILGISRNTLINKLK
jgi:DNA-binding protein Fis